MMEYEEIKTVCRNNCGFLNRHHGEASQKKVELFDLLSLWVWTVYNNLNCNSGRDEGAGGPVEVFSEREKVVLCLHRAFIDSIIISWWLKSHISKEEFKVYDDTRRCFIKDLLRSKETKVSRQYLATIKRFC